MLPLHTHAQVRGVSGKAILKVILPEEKNDGIWDPARCLIWSDSSSNRKQTECAGYISPVAPFEPSDARQIEIGDIKTAGVVGPGDVIRVSEDNSRVSVLYRRGATSNTLLATERCNSHCVMCSQPPRDVDDRWLTDEALEAIPLIDKSEKQLGISGGEPTLLGDDLAVIIHQARVHLPETGLHILTNGRRFNDPAFARQMTAVGHSDLCWGIPLYSSSPDEHDYIVQTKGAWEE